jgi:hypothetical protein
MTVDFFDLKAFFHRFVAEVPTSPLYQAMCPLLAEDDVALDLYRSAAPMQHRPNLLLAAIHDSLIRDRNHELGGWFATLNGARAANDPQLPAVLRAFIRDREDELRALVTSGGTQTNEVGRSAFLFPSLATVDTDQPLALIDVGTSAGLNLHLDQYAITYDDALAKTAHNNTAHNNSAQNNTGDESGANAETIGPKDALVQMHCDASRSEHPLPYERMRALSFGDRIGIDINPLDIHDETQRRWLRALVWPDEVERFSRLGHALTTAQGLPVAIQRGDATTDTSALIATVPANQHPVVITTWVVTYFPPQARQAFVEQLHQSAQLRDLSWICLEHPLYCQEIPWPEATLAAHDGSALQSIGIPVVLHQWRGGNLQSRWIADAQPHGRWINWHPATT